MTRRADAGRRGAAGYPVYLADAPLAPWPPMTFLLLWACVADPPAPAPPPKSREPPAPVAPAEPRPNVIVIDIDSLRADSLQRRHGDQDVMPNVHALMARGVTFTQAFAQSGWTVPALASLLTGRWPVSVSVGADSTPVLPASSHTFPELLGLYGYQTTVLWGTGVEVGFESLSRGFARTLARTASLGQTKDDLAVYDGWTPTPPFALFVHDFDAHVPGPWFTAANMHTFGDGGFRCTGASYRETYEGLVSQVGPERVMAHVRTHYDGVVHGYDALLGRLLARLQERGLLEHTIVLVTSNHGEDFGDHGPGIKHGGLYDVTLRVPLVVAGPGVGPPGTRIDTPVQGIDLAPTLLALAHVPADAAMDGLSFADLLAGDPAAPGLAERPVFSLTNARNLSIRTPTAKLIRTDEPDAGNPPPPPGTGPGGPSGARPGGPQGAPGTPPTPGGPRGEPRLEYYDLRADPDERHDLYADRPAGVDDLERALDAFAEDRARAAASGERLVVDEALRAAVRERGYFGVAGGGEAP